MIEIAGRKIGPGYPPYFIADIGANHDGDLQRAYRLIDLAAKAGADAVKFQNFSASKLVSRRGFAELGKIGHQADWDTDVYSEYEAASVPVEWASYLQAECAACGTVYLTTPYDLEVVDVIDPYVPAWKIGSGDITYHSLIRHVASKGKPVLLATGASSAEDVDRAIGAYFGGTPPDPIQYGQNIVLMQCNTNYSGNPENLQHLNLRVLRLSEEYNAIPGLSDHTFGHLSVCAAIALGACVIEKHFTDDRNRKGPDHAFAMEPDEWRRMVDAARITWGALGDGVKKIEENEKDAVIIQRRALRYRADLRAGTELDGGDIIPTRPCPPGALEPCRISEILGKQLVQDVEADTLVQFEDVDWGEEEGWE